MTQGKRLDKSSVLYPSRWDIADAKALQQVAAGEATPEQQRRALRWIINEACGTYDMPFRPGSDGARDTDFACGKQFVGQQIVKLVNVDLLAIQQNKAK